MYRILGVYQQPVDTPRSHWSVALTVTAFSAATAVAGRGTQVSKSRVLALAGTVLAYLALSLLDHRRRADRVAL